MSESKSRVPVNLSLNGADIEDKEVLIKVAKPKAPKESAVEKIRSFRITSNMSHITIQGKNIPMGHLYTVLQKYGVSKTLPLVVRLDKQLIFDIFDPSPTSWIGPTVWSFTYDNISCSLCVSTNIYIRVHDLTPGVGERIVLAISEEVLTYWINPIPANTFAIYTTTTDAYGRYTWRNHSVRQYRDFDTIYMDPKMKKSLISDMDNFLSTKAKILYNRYGRVYKKVILFHGKPGSGKTSTVVALASRYGKSISKFTLTPNLNSQHIESLFSSIPNGTANTWILMEDVDSLFAKREANTSIDFSTLLNCMDGIATLDGMVLFMTTNHITQLDDAFVRPGRVDLCLEFHLPGTDELRDALKVLGSEYSHEHEEFLIKHGKGMTIAQLQNHLFECVMGEKKSILDYSLN